MFRARVGDGGEGDRLPVRGTPACLSRGARPCLGARAPLILRPCSRPHVAGLVGELVDQDVVPECRLTDLGTATAVHREPVAVLLHDLDGALRGSRLPGEQGGQAGGMRAADGHPGSQPGAGEVGGLLVGDQRAPLQGDDPVGGAGGLLGIGRGRQHGTALVRVGAQHAVQPAVLAPGKPVGRIVEDEGVRVREQSAGQAQPPVHAAGQGAEAFVAQTHQADHLEHFVGPPHRNPGGRAQHAQVAPDRAGRVPRHIAEEDADLARGVGDTVQRTAPEVGEPAALLEFEHQSQRRGLARARRSEQHGDAARARLEGDVVDGGRKRLAGVAGQSEGLDHP